jgi:hypothetical protein
MKLVALVTDPKTGARYLSRLGEPIEVPARTPSGGLPTVLEEHGAAPKGQPPSRIAA